MSVRGEGTFSKLVNDFAKKTPEIARQSIDKSVLELFAKVVMDTPVDTGHARNNWQISIGHENTVELDGDDKTGSETIRRAQETIFTDKTTAPIFIQNNVPYINRLEYDHWSQKAPYGMLRRNILLMNQYLKNAIAELGGGK